MKSSKSIGIVIIILLFIGAIYWAYTNQSAPNNPTVNVKSNTQVQATTVQVGMFYDGKNGYSLSIPSGNTSTCIWTYAGGSAAVPYSTTTVARTATEKHTIYSSDFYDWKVSCVDDFGNQYIGIFPTE